MTRFTTVLLALIVTTVGCGKKDASKNPKSETPESYPEPKVGTLPELSPKKMIEPGVAFQEATVSPLGVPMKIWIYLPEKRGKASGDKLTTVLVAPAGSTLAEGMDLGDGDRAEQLPYARAGFAVVAYEIDGHVPDVRNASHAQRMAGSTAYRNARAGVTNAKVALDYALAKVPAVDPQRIFTAGHSSAGVLSLLVAMNDDRIKGCIAYAPCTDVVSRLAPFMGEFDSIPGFRNFIKEYSPLTHVAKLRCPAFLFQAEDDTNPPITELTAFVNQLQQRNKNVTFVRARRGGHYQPMIDEGIPQAIRWMRATAK